MKGNTMSSWAASYIADLRAGKAVHFRPRGNSMKGRIESGELVTVVPMETYGIANLSVNDIVLCKVRGRVYLHLIKAKKEGQVQIGNNRGYINGWTAISNIYGVRI